MKPIALYAMQAAIGGVLLLAGGSKLAGLEITVREFELVGLGQWFRIAAGMIEMGAGLLLFIPRLALCGALLVSCLTVAALGATVARVAQMTPIPLPPSMPYIAVSEASQA